MNSPFVSIIIPIYNVEKYLEKCLMSCVSQTLDNIEIICVNDASPDNCALIVKKYADLYPGKVIPVHLKENLRQGGARNVGIKMARGNYLCFVDGDDYIDVDMCKELYDIAIRNNRDLVCCDGYMVYDSRKCYLEMIKRSNLETFSSINCFTSQCFMIIKKSIIENSDLYYPEKIFSEDTAVVPLWYVKSTSRELVKKPYYYQVYHEDSSSRVVNFADQLQMIVAVRIMLDNAKRIAVHEQYERQLSVFVGLRTVGFITQRNKLPEPSAEEMFLLYEEIKKWMNYKFNKELFHRYFTLSEIRAIDKIFESGQIIMVHRNVDNYFEDRDGNIYELCEYIASELNATIVIWGYGEYGEKIVNSIHKLGFSYLVGDSNESIQNSITLWNDIIHDKKWIDENVENPFYFISVKRNYTDIVCCLKLDDCSCIDIREYIENGRNVEYIKRQLL